MNSDIFRKKSLARIQSPEDLNDCIRVTNPGVWLLLAGMIILLAGACVWGIFGHIETTVRANLQNKDGMAVCFVREEDIASVKTGNEVRVGDAVGVVRELGTAALGTNTYRVYIDIELPDGAYAAEIVTESIQPLSFVLN